jgi:hypothetical protein
MFCFHLRTPFGIYALWFSNQGVIDQENLILLPFI